MVDTDLSYVATVGVGPGPGSLIVDPVHFATQD